MAKKRISAKSTTAKADIQDIQDVRFMDAHSSACDFRRLAAQFFVIGQELGWKGTAGDLARTGQRSAEAMHKLLEERCDEIRNEVESAQ